MPPMRRPSPAKSNVDTKVRIGMGVWGLSLREKTSSASAKAPVGRLILWPRYVSTKQD